MGPIDPDSLVPPPPSDMIPVVLPDGRTVYLVPPERQARRYVKNAFLNTLQAPSLPVVSLPVDWTNGDEIDFPILGNDRYGDCFMAAICHQDQSMTGCATGAETVFDEATVIKEYKKLSGGDFGLNEDQVVPYWTENGLPGHPDATIFDHVDIDPTNAPLMQAAAHFFGGVQFQFNVPPRWTRSFQKGAVWDLPVGIPIGGHAVYFAGVGKDGNYKLVTWGSWCWLTPAALARVHPTAFVVASTRQFNDKGFAPNGLHYNDLSKLWVGIGGHPWKAGVFPDPADNPPPGPTPTPSPGGQTVTIPSVQIGIYTAKLTIDFNVDQVVPTPPA